MLRPSLSGAALVLLACAATPAASPSPTPHEQRVAPVPATQPDASPIADDEPDPGPRASFPQSSESPPDGPCTGDSADVRKLLAERAGDSRSCYERTLRKDPQLSVRVVVSVRMDTEGNAWTHVTPDELDGEMKECIVQLFARPFQAAPTGGCMDAQIPIHFVPKQKSP